MGGGGKPKTSVRTGLPSLPSPLSMSPHILCRVSVIPPGLARSAGLSRASGSRVCELEAGQWGSALGREWARLRGRRGWVRGLVVGASGPRQVYRDPCLLGTFERVAGVRGLSRVRAGDGASRACLRGGQTTGESRRGHRKPLRWNLGTRGRRRDDRGRDQAVAECPRTRRPFSATSATSSRAT